jgi:hypothetical protein
MSQRQHDWKALAAPKLGASWATCKGVLSGTGDPFLEIQPAPLEPAPPLACQSMGRSEFYSISCANWLLQLVLARGDDVQDTGRSPEVML